MTWFGKAIELGTKSPYSHIGIILKSPTYIDEKLNGIYLWESDSDFTKDAETNEIILGVKLTPIHDVLDWKEYIYLKKLNKDYNYKFDEESIKTIYNATKNIPYDLDIKDWIAAFFRNKLIKTDKRFFCSAFVSFILVQLGLLKLNCDFSIIQPRDYDANYSNYLHDYWIYNSTYSNNLIQLK